MSRTRRTQPWKMYRRPKTFNQIQSNEALLSDIKCHEFDYSISKMNRIRRYIPDAWEDLPISSNFES